ncbi:MAG: CheR family methyltransferase [Janthinobacterium lividum]
MAEKPQSFLIVGLGASAGGIQALRTFFQHVPEDSPVAYVVILHLSPDHDSQLMEVLQEVSRLPVMQVVEKVAIAPGHIYVVSPSQHLIMEEDFIVPTPTLHVEERRAPVDIFFRTLADTHGARAVCVVLSGTGANGSMGLKRVKERGGVAYVQNPREAEYNEMPRNAIATELVDEVLPVAEIPGRVLAYLSGLDMLKIPVQAVRPEEQQQALREIFAHLRLRTGHDFSNYKQATLLRRIERRISVRGLPDLPTYAAFLLQHSEESHALLKDLLISVTNFFRDTKPFQALEQEILPAIFQAKNPDSTVRIWVVGCATGEEAYSVAMLVAERTMGQLDAPKVQIFATDIDEAAIATAREGLYTLNDAADVSPARLLRFFTKEGDSYRVQRELREMVLFANHNFLKDPPFSRLDLVSCRNVLIYLNATAQQQVMETFHFALKPAGFLLLGSSESMDGASNLYATVSRENHFYQAREVASPRYPLPESVPALPPKPADFLAATEAEGRPASRFSLGELHQKLLEQYAPPSLVVNAEYDILHMSEKVGGFLELSGGEPTKNLLKLIRPELRLELRAALHQAAHLQTAIEARNVPWNQNGKRQSLTIQVKPVTKEGDTTKGFMLVIFEPNEHVQPDDKVVLTTDAPMARQLEEELMQAKIQLRYSAEQYEYQAEELKASNEEFQAVNEELRSAAEELETSKEELQSINEELRTVNQEMKVKIEEMGVTSSNLQNLINSAGVATIFLDRAFCIRLYTPVAQQLFNLIPSDYGRPISDITHRLKYDNLLPDIETVLDKLTQLEREVNTTDQRAFLMRIPPYRTLQNRIDGVVITLFDITDRKQAEETMRASQATLAAVFEALPLGVGVFDMQGHSMLANSQMQHYLPTGRMPSEDATQYLRWRATHPDGRPLERSEFPGARALRGEKVVPGVEMRHTPEEGRDVWTQVIAVPLPDGRSRVSGLVTVIIDIDARKRAEEAVATDLAGMQRLHELHTKLAAEPNLKLALKEIVALACDVTNTDRGCMQLVSHDGQRLEMYAYQGYAESSRFIQHFLHESVQTTYGAAQRDHTRLLIEDVEAYPPLAGTIDQEVALAEGIRAIQSTPLLTRSSGLVGVLSNQFRQPHRPTEHQLKLLDLLAWTAADFIERHRTIQALEQLSVGLEQQVHERTAQLNESAETLQKSLAQLLQAEEVAQMGSWEYDIASGQLVWSSGMYRLLGLPASSAASLETYLGYVVEADKASAEQLMQQARTGVEPLDATLRLLVAGQVHTFHIRSVVLRNDLGEPIKVLGLDLDISEVKRLEEENLQMRLNQQKTLLLGILDAQEEERRRIAESLHNGVGQLLFATKLNFDQVAPLVPKEVFQGANQLLDEAIQETRRVSHELVPSILEEVGLGKAIQDLCLQYSKTRVRINCEVTGLENRLESHLEVAIYRICQELLTNVTKHANATNAAILLVQEDGEVTLKVRDNGKGISPKSSKETGIGLRTIQDRIKLLNGTFTLHTPDTGRGTQVTIQIPTASSIR